MTWGSIRWGNTSWGGGSLISGTGVLYLNPVNLEPGCMVQFPAVAATLDGQSVTSPISIPEEGYYELVLDTSPHTMVVPLVVVDTSDLQVKTMSMEFEDKTPTYKRMTGRLPLSYARGERALPRFATATYMADVLVNKAVVLTLRAYDGTKVHEMGRLLARDAGRFTSSEFLLPRGRSKVQASVQVQANPHIITQQQMAEIAATYGPTASLTLAAPVSPTPAGASLPVSNNAVYDLNAYGAVGVAGYASNYQAVDAAVYDAGPAQYIAISGQNELGTFAMAAIADPRVLASLTHVLTVRNTGTNQKAYVTPVVRDAATEVIAYGRDWELPADNTWYDVPHIWPTNPFTGVSWQPGDLSSSRYRFGIRRVAAGAPIQCQRIYLEAAY